MVALLFLCNFSSNRVLAFLACEKSLAKHAKFRKGFWFSLRVLAIFARPKKLPKYAVPQQTEQMVMNFFGCFGVPGM